MQIKNLKVGDPIKGVLAVLHAEIKLTKTSKPYLFITLFDGETEIVGNYWDWPHKNAPLKNITVHVEGTISEYNGTKQLKFGSLMKDATKKIEDFAPHGNINIDELFATLTCILQTIQQPTIKAIVENIIQSNMYYLRKAPGAKKIHHAYVTGLLEHLVSAAILANSIVKNFQDSNKFSEQMPISRDLCVGGALIHDIGKLEAYIFDGIAIEDTLENVLLEHIPAGITYIDKFYRDDEPKNSDHNVIVTLLKHIILSHHGKQEWGSPVIPKCFEAFVVHMADYIDSNYQIMKSLNKTAQEDSTITAKSWHYSNYPLMKQSAIYNILNKEE